jgi:hypothetical protein
MYFEVNVVTIYRVLHIYFASNGIHTHQARSLHELRGSLYDTLPNSLKAPTLVRTKTESPEVRKERCELVRTKTPTQLANIRDIHDIPIPGLWREREGSSSRSKNKKRR